MSILDNSEIKFGSIFNQITTFLTNTYSQVGDVFSPSSAYGQLLTVMQAFQQMMFLYLEDSIVEQNINTASKLTSIQGFSRLTGHNPTRALSAQGTILLKWKPNVVDLNANYVTIPDGTQLTCTNNSLPYFIRITNVAGSVNINTSNYQYTSMKIIQGVIESQSVLGTGLNMQSFNFQSNKPIDNENVMVTVNGVSFDLVDSLYDMVKGENCCMVKTGIDGGIDIYFGNPDFGYVPPLGANIVVSYVKSDGYSGNIFGKSSAINFTFTNTVYSNTGDEVDLNQYMNISVDKPILLGADPEDSNLTQLIAPLSSRSFVLANPNNYIALLSRFNYSYVDAYTTYNDQYINDSNIIYLFLIPDISRRLDISSDYFVTDISNFTIDSDEVDALYNYIDNTGSQIVSTELQVIQPILTYYVMNIFLSVYDTIDQTTIYNQIVTIVSDYLVSIRRRDKIPKSDLMSLLEQVEGIDSLNVTFVSKKNEDAIIAGYYVQTTTTTDAVTGLNTVTETQIPVQPGIDPSLGIDEFGDVVIGLNELPLFRGGWYDRYGNYYEDGLSTTNYSSVNVIFSETITETPAIMQMNQNMINLRNNINPQTNQIS